MITLLRTVSFSIVLTVTALPATVHAVTYPSEMLQFFEDNAIVKTSSELYVFYGGSGDIRKDITLNELLPVYHLDASCSYQESGKVRVIAFAGQNYFDVKVVEGVVRWGDIAKKNGLSFLIGYVPESAVKCLQK